MPRLYKITYNDKVIYRIQFPHSKTPQNSLTSLEDKNPKSLPYYQWLSSVSRKKTMSKWNSTYGNSSRKKSFEGSQGNDETVLVEGCQGNRFPPRRTIAGHHQRRVRPCSSSSLQIDISLFLSRNALLPNYSMKWSRLRHNISVYIVSPDPNIFNMKRRHKQSWSLIERENRSRVDINYSADAIFIRRRLKLCMNIEKRCV